MHALPYMVEVWGRYGQETRMFGRLGAVRDFCRSAMQNGATELWVRHQGSRLHHWNRVEGWTSYPSPVARLGQSASSLSVLLHVPLLEQEMSWMRVWAARIPLILIAAMQDGAPLEGYPRESGPHRMEDLAEIIDWRATLECSEDLAMWLRLAMWSLDSFYPAYERRAGNAHPSAARVRWLLDRAPEMADWMPRSVGDMRAHHAPIH